MTAAERATAVEEFGYTPRQAAFIALVAEHSGYFLRRQWLTFAWADGACATNFLHRLVDRSHARAVRIGKLTQIYHVAFRPLYSVMGEPFHRHWRQVQPFKIIHRLMRLDFVLAFSDRAWYGLEREKVALFTEQYGLDVGILPSTRFHFPWRGGSAVRHFAENAVVGVAPSSAVTLAYVNSAGRPTRGFGTFLDAYAPLIARLPAVGVLYVSRGSDWGSRAQAVFAKRYPSEQTGRPTPSSRLVEHFRARQRLESGDFADISERDMEQLRSELVAFRGPMYDRLYHAWQSGDSVVTTPAPTFETYHVPYTYPLGSVHAEVAAISPPSALGSAGDPEH